MPPSPTAIPRLELTNAPTPLLPLERLSRELGVELWMKRDDLTGLLESGSEIRKLEFLLGEARSLKADTLIHCGTLQSNSCRIVAAVAARFGLRAVLALRGAPPAEYDGNLLLVQLLGAEVRYCGEGKWARVDDVLGELAERERAAGRAPYVIPESGASVTGALGYAACAQEIAQQIRHGAPEFDTLVIAAFSGGSQAGLLIGKQLTGLRAEIVGVPIAGTADAVRRHIADALVGVRQRYGLAVDVPQEIRLLDGYQGAGRGDVRAEALDTVVQVARTEGIVLDPIVTAKAFHGMLDTLRRDRRALGRRVCFVHTGGIFSVFGFREALGPRLPPASV
jgi:D-cysteine desulfhydrase family pyridoxal phosphate-dependent enzyme